MAVTQRSSARCRHWPFRCCSSPVPSFDQPPTLDDLSKVIASPSNPEGSWDASAWEEPKPFTAEELASLRAEFGHPGEEPEDPDTANADELARFQKDVARVNGWAAAYGLPPVMTCRDTLNLFLVAGVLHKVVEDGAVRFRPAWPFPRVEEVFSLTPEEQAHEDEIRWRHLHEGTAQDIINLFDPNGEHPRDSLTTSLERLGRKLDLDPESIRDGILGLLDEGDFSCNIDITTALAHRVFTLTVDWEEFAATRINLRIHRR
jgi:Family of unknown function (DUF6042)